MPTLKIMPSPPATCQALSTGGLFAKALKRKGMSQSPLLLESLSIKQRHNGNERAKQHISPSATSLFLCIFRLLPGCQVDWLIVGGMGRKRRNSLQIWESTRGFKEGREERWSILQSQHRELALWLFFFFFKVHVGIIRIRGRKVKEEKVKSWKGLQDLTAFRNVKVSRC